ncbi:hypothetical protein QRX50_40800 [Amycolatopsis carbonis]|uniref:Uncharacterized protein n=1 Tax=Amycolatopsis carbonis TaxID=715471 RepID=A0A9Y2MQU5_9PSEU|nr:hypothetical protein [Amycolatopsis sp. 2-15]WIX77680.1 hypothetical protein QRX50_40800 [Amycolatopsis sp. 2-15]
MEGTFTVTGTAVTGGEDGSRHIRFSGVLRGPGVPGTAGQASRAFAVGETPPVEGDELPATIDRAKPERFEIAWPPRVGSGAKASRDKAHAEQVAAVVRLGLDPSVVPAPIGRVPGLREMAALALGQRYARHPLPDGNLPVRVEEAAPFVATGEAATATITGIDFLTVPADALPEPEATLANVAVRVRRADGSEDTTTARFGFRTAARRTQIGHVGAQVPVRLDPADRRRVCLDSRALPRV